MAGQNVEVVRRAFESWNSGDMDAFAEAFDESVIVRAPDGWPEPGPFVGRAAVMDQFRGIRAAWDRDEVTPVGDFIEAGDRVGVRILWRGLGHGPEGILEITGSYTIRAGRIVFLEYFWDHADALDSLGLGEQAQRPPTDAPQM